MVLCTILASLTTPRLMNMLYGKTPVADALSKESGTKILYFGVGTLLLGKKRLFPRSALAYVYLA